MKRGQNKISMPFAARPVAMLESAGYQVLSRAALMVLSRLEIENHRHGGGENGHLVVTYDDFVKYPQ
jgi:hypothetical protein